MDMCINIFVSGGIETVVLLTHNWDIKAEKAFKSRVSFTGSNFYSKVKETLLFLFEGTYPGMDSGGVWLWVYYLGKRENDFTILAGRGNEFARLTNRGPAPEPPRFIALGFP